MQKYSNKFLDEIMEDMVKYRAKSVQQAYAIKKRYEVENGTANEEMQKDCIQ